MPSQSLFGLLLLSLGVFGAWLFATGRLDAVARAIASGASADTSATSSSSSSPAPVGTNTLSGDPGGLTPAGRMPAAQSSGLSAVALGVDPTTGALVATLAGIAA